MDQELVYAIAFAMDVVRVHEMDRMLEFTSDPVMVLGTVYAMHK